MVDNGFFFGSLPKFNAADTDYSVKLLAMRVVGLAGMLAMGALIIAM